MTMEPWQEPKPTMDQLRRLVARIQSYARTSRIMGYLSTIFLIALMLQFGILVYSQFLFFLWFPAPIYLPEWFYYVMFITFALSMVIYGLANTVNARLNRFIIEYKRIGVVVQLRCEECNRTSDRVWEKDDFVFKKEGQCACGGTQYVSQMYIMPLPLKEKDKDK